MRNPAGLTSQKAAELLVRFGPNEITSGRRIQPLAIFFSQFRSFLILILIAAAPIAWLAGEKLDTIFILGIVFLNAVFGFVQEYQAEKAIAALKKLVVDRVRVIRDGQEVEILAKDLVPGDVFVVEEGQKIPADGQLLEAINLATNEASLTGESAAVAKEASLGARQEDKSLIFAGTVCERGLGKAKVIATGMKTRFGQIASLLEGIEEEETPLQKNLATLGKQLAIIGFSSAVLVFGLGSLTGKDPLQMLLTGASLAVAVVPEGLPAVVTITLAVGVQRMAKRAAIIRKLSSIETIGSIDVICSDKTGTITRNEMVVKKIWTKEKVWEINSRILKEDNIALDKILRIGVLCSTAALSRTASGKVTVLGDRTEGSLLMIAQEAGREINKIRQDGRLINEFSFDATLKMMSVLWQDPSGGIEVLTKGAPEMVMAASQKLLRGEKEELLNQKSEKEIETQIASWASKGLRLVGFGFKKLTIDPRGIAREEVEKDLTFVGLVAIEDPPRGEVKEAIAVAQGAGIRVVMITGDNPLTALSIGREIGLVAEETEVLSGKELDTLTEDELQEMVQRIRIFARVAPLHKLRIVKAFQKNGARVAVTGDGVNDSPALKQADVGMAMGIIGTDVAKEASEMVVADDNFASIVKAVEEGRVIHENILKSIRYLLSCNSGELLAILGAITLGFPSPLTPIQILWMNLVTDGLPALALASDPKREGVMKYPPESRSGAILTLLGKKFILLVGVLLATLTLAFFIVFFAEGELGRARTIAFTILVIGEMMVAFLVRRGSSWYSNRFLIGAVLITFILQFLILTLPPLQKIFDTVPLF